MGTTRKIGLKWFFIYKTYSYFPSFGLHIVPDREKKSFTGFDWCRDYKRHVSLDDIRFYTDTGRSWVRFSISHHIDGEEQYFCLDLPWTFTGKEPGPSSFV